MTSQKNLKKILQEILKEYTSRQDNLHSPITHTIVDPSDDFGKLKKNLQKASSIPAGIISYLRETGLDAASVDSLIGFLNDMEDGLSQLTGTKLGQWDVGSVVKGIKQVKAHLKAKAPRSRMESFERIFKKVLKENKIL